MWFGSVVFGKTSQGVERSVMPRFGKVRTGPVRRGAARGNMPGVVSFGVIGSGGSG